MQRVIKAAIAACLPGGDTYEYFSANSWEAEMRASFAHFSQTFNKSGRFDAEEGIRLLRRLNANYRARYPIVALPYVYQSATTVLSERGWWNIARPDLLKATEDEIMEVATTLKVILAHVAQNPVAQPFSLVTKWLHFCFPDTFAICDEQAISSIQTCSDHVHSHLSVRDPLRRKFRKVAIYEAGGNGYVGVLNFYRLCGEVAETSGILTELRAAALSLEFMQHQHLGCLNTRVSAVDVLDKHLWKANGDAGKLGF